MAAVGGAACALVGGLFNGSWLVPTKDDAPAAFRIRGGWRYEHFWTVFCAASLVMNCVLVASIYGADLGRAIAAESSNAALVAFISTVWGVGSAQFGRAVRVAGVALGISLTIGVVLVSGTLGPLFLDLDEAVSAAGGLTLLGVLIALFGLGFLAQAGLRKEADKTVEAGAPAAEQDEPHAAVSFSFAIVVCVGAGLLASLLQYAFIFGGPLLNQMKDRGYGNLTEPMIIWFFAIGCCQVVGIGYGALLLHEAKSWGGFVPFSAHNTGLACLCGAMWIGHIHLLGISSALLGDKLGPALGWALLMSSTVLTSQAWSHFLGEWRGASERSRVSNRNGMLVLLVSIATIGAAAAVS